MMNDYEKIEEQLKILSLTLDNARIAAGSVCEKDILAKAGVKCYELYSEIDDVLSKRYTRKIPCVLRAENALNVDYSIDTENMLVRIEFDGRLPSRREVTSGKSSYNRTTFNTMLARTIAYVFRDYPSFRYDEKVDLLIYQEYKTRSSARDHDNTDIKSVIDYLCAGHVIDDSPEFLRLRLDGAVTGRNHVSIFMSPVSFLAS